eukprot:TRINITY_DN11590_c0_g2_i1.p1 TRINITY_DN11590_c0_g2~~TRINITY_DN11590_c0_g2_i1.p1  ORF type:complete len:760 (+),score=249.26 TRINITY_DN11590_c0_g2_i1:102-2381(+)
MAGGAETRRGRYDIDGLVNEIYSLIWTYSISGEFHSHILEGIYIPETVVIEQGFPRVWFCWASDQGELEKKLGKEIVLSKVYSQWVKGHDPTIPVAEFMSPRIDALKGDATLTKEYFDAEGLLRFLQTRAHGVTGLLQKFVLPKPTYNVIYQATWTPHHMLCSARRNIHNLNHVWVDMLDRCCTFDGPPSASAPAPVSPFVHQKIQRELERFASHVREQQRSYVTGMVCFLKVNQDGMLHLMQCTSLRVAKDGYQPVAPLDLTVRFERMNRQKESDVLVFRYERKIGGRPGLPRIDLTNVTDTSLDALDIDKSDMLYLPQRSRGSPRPARQKMIAHLPESTRSTPMLGGSGRAVHFIDMDTRLQDAARLDTRASIGLPEVGKEYPNEWAILTGYLEDILYTTHWYFFENGCCETGDRSHTEDHHVPPFEFVVPEEVMSILGYEGVQQLMALYGAEDACDGNYTERRENGEVMQQMRLRLTKPSAMLLDMDTMRQFAVDRLVEGLPKYEGGIDWEQIRERKGPRRTTEWMLLVGATDGALKVRQRLKKKLQKQKEEERAAARVRNREVEFGPGILSSPNEGMATPPFCDDFDADDDAAAASHFPKRMSTVNADTARRNSNVVSLAPGDASVPNNTLSPCSTELVSPGLSGDDDPAALTPEDLSPTLSNAGLALFSKHPKPPDQPRPEQKKQAYLKGHTRSHAKTAYKPGVWKMQAAFPAPPAAPKNRRRHSPKREKNPAFPTQRTTLRSGAEQLDFWCQL